METLKKVKTKVHIIGKGKWGKIIENTISDMVEFVNPFESDWVIISTPNDLHYELTMYWLSQGKNVFCEKPLTLSYDSAIQLYELADAMGCKLYVDDVFAWRDDYPIYDDMNYFVWTKPEQKNINFIDRLAYHHFMMWVGNTDFEIKSIEGQSDDFKVELEDGRTSMFKYGFSNETIHCVNEVDLTNYGGEPLKTMFEFLFTDMNSYELNKKLSLNAIRMSEKVKEVVYPKALVVGAGVFGLSSALELNNYGFQVDVKEKSNDILSGASSINQYRLHRGYHYPRSKETAKECLDGLKTFKRKYGDCVVNGDITHMYSIASEDSLVNADEYKKFLDEMNLPYQEVESMPNCDLTIVAKEELYNPQKLKQNLEKKVWNTNVKVYLNTEVMDLEQYKKDYDVVVIATYSNINQLLENKKNYQYELCEKPVVKLPKIFEDLSVVVMDGPFMCLDPYGDEYHVLGNVNEAIHTWNEGTEPVWDDKYTKYINKGLITNPDPELTKIDKFIESGVKYFGDEFADLEHIGSMYTIRTVLSNRDHDDARPTLVSHEEDNVWSLFSGKIDTCVDASKELIRKINE
jgi:ribulose 1,5-bisphosphate synthetase/thiazole synthase